MAVRRVVAVARGEPCAGGSHRAPDDLLADRVPLGVVAVEQAVGGARPATARASFQARLYASWMPVFMPCAPVGGWMCAASPATKTRPTP